MYLRFFLLWTWTSLTLLLKKYSLTISKTRGHSHLCSCRACTSRMVSKQNSGKLIESWKNKRYHSKMNDFSMRERILTRGFTIKECPNHDIWCSFWINPRLYNRVEGGKCLTKNQSSKCLVYTHPEKNLKAFNNSRIFESFSDYKATNRLWVTVGWHVVQYDFSLYMAMQ